MSTPAEGEGVESGEGEASREVRTALGNAIKLSLSLAGTILVHLVVRTQIPRFLEPALFGKLNFADAYSATFFSFATFGVDTYIRKEVATRPAHANDFYAGFFVLRLAASGLLLGLMALGLIGKDSLTWQLAYIFAAGRIAYIDNQTVGAFLQAVSQVNELSWVNVLSKVMWGVSIVSGLWAGEATRWIALCFFVSEVVKTVYLMWVLHRRMHLRWHVDMSQTFQVVRKSGAYFLNNVALMIYSQLNIILLGYLSSDTEVGYYGATMQIAVLAGFFVPVLQSVVMPMAARTAKRSVDAMNELMRTTMRLVIASVTAMSLVLMLHAEWVAKLAFGNKYALAGMSLRMIAPMFPLTYMATIASLHLIQQNRNWTLLRVSLLTVVLNPLLNAPLILWGASRGPGWPGSMSALATVLTEVITVAINFWLLGRHAVDRRLVEVLGRTAMICAAVVGLHFVAAPWGIWRMPVEILLYGGLAVLLNTLPVGEVRRMIAEARRSRQGLVG